MVELYPYLEQGWLAVREYVFTKMAGAFLPAFFIAGGLATLVPRSAIVKWLSAGVPRTRSYPAALFGGGVLSVCACGILPLFQTIYQRGAGAGPAVAFLFAGPAINVIAILYTFDLLGPSLGWARLVAVAILAILIGILFEAFFSKSEESRVSPNLKLAGQPKSDARMKIVIFGCLMMASILLPMEKIPRLPRFGGALIAILGAILASLHGLEAHERKAWMEKTWFLIRQIVPKLVLGIFLVGALEQPTRNLLASYMTSDGFLACLIAASIGGFLYLGTIIGVVVVHAMIQLGMPEGPALAFMLAGPSICLPSLWVIASVMGRARALAFGIMVLVFSALIGYGYSLCFS